MASDICVGIKTEVEETFHVLPAGYAYWATLTPSFLTRSGARWREVSSSPKCAPNWVADILLIDFSAAAALWSSGYAHEHYLEASLRSTEGLRQFGACYAHYRADSAEFFEDVSRVVGQRVVTERSRLTKEGVTFIFQRFEEAGLRYDAEAEAMVLGSDKPTGNDDIGRLLSGLGVSACPLPEHLFRKTLVAVPKAWVLSAIDPRHARRTETITGFMGHYGWRTTNT